MQDEHAGAGAAALLPDAAGRVCSICGETRSKEAFSKRQWQAKAHSRRCSACSDQGPPGAGAAGQVPRAAESPTARTASLRFIPKAVGAKVHVRTLVHFQAADAHGPPPWHDERLEPEFQNASMVLEPPFQQFLKAVDRCEVSVDVITSEGGMREFHRATCWADIPAMKALLRRGARIDAFAFNGSPLQSLCGFMVHMGEFHEEKPGRSLLKAFEFLLNVGANPNALPNMALGDIDPHPGDPVGPLEVAVSIRNSQLAKRVVELLVKHGADPASHPRGGARTVFNACSALMKRSLRRQLELRKLEADRGAALSPVRLCPCGSDRPFDACHGNTDAAGVPLHPKALCPCRGEKGKTYDRCCLQKGITYRETLEHYVEIRRTGNTEAESHYSRIADELERRGTPLPPSMPPALGREITSMMKSLVQPLVREGRVDPAFAWAVVRCDFYWARPWRRNNVQIISSEEMRKRQLEWNALIDQYIRDSFEDEDGRSVCDDLSGAAVPEREREREREREGERERDRERGREGGREGWREGERVGAGALLRK